MLIYCTLRELGAESIRKILETLLSVDLKVAVGCWLTVVEINIFRVEAKVLQHQMSEGWGGLLADLI